MYSEDIKKIAESMGYDTRYIWDGVIEILISCDEVGMEDWQIFDPCKDDADAFKVLEALVDKDVQQAISLMRSFKYAQENCPQSKINIKLSICDAYLSLIEL